MTISQARLSGDTSMDAVPLAAPSDSWSKATRVGVAITVAAVFGANLAWIALDHQAPAWDQANYLHIVYLWRSAFHQGGLGQAISAIYHADPSHPPLYMLAIAPFEAIDQGVGASLVANTLMLCVLVPATAMIAARLYGQRAAFPAALFVATCTMIIGLSRTTLVDIMLVLLVVLAVLAVVLSNGFERRGWALAVGALVGLATLTKMTAPAFVLAPALVALALPERRLPRQQVTNGLLAAATALLVALPWYVVNIGPAWSYLRSATGGELAIGTTAHPLSLDALLAFAAGTLDTGIGLILAVVLVVATVLAWQSSGWRRLKRQDLARIALPVSWFGVAFVVVAASHNQDIRFLAPGIPGLAVLAAGAVAAVTPRLLRLALLGLATGALTWQFVTYVTPFPSAGSASIEAGPASFRLTLHMDGSPLAYERRPGVPDYATPVIRKLMTVREQLTPHGYLPVCILETQEVINGNTIGFVAETLGVPVLLTDLSYLPRVSPNVLAIDLSGCQSALYIPGHVGSGRSGVLNQASAAAQMTPAELAQFKRAGGSLPVGDGLRVQVLERTR
jgi:hypothetical protein